MKWWNSFWGRDREGPLPGALLPALPALPEPPAPLGEADALRLGPLILAHVGDAVYDLHVRTRLALAGPAKPRDMHRRTVSYVRATAQATAMRALAPHLTAPESDLVRRARNARPGHVPRGVEAGIYAQSTGLEALLGYLYLTGQSDRLGQLLTAAVLAAPGGEF